MYRARVYNGKKYKAHGKNGRKRKKKNMKLLNATGRMCVSK